jgi:RimJ/RimL family protein N-acetyltransferase
MTIPSYAKTSLRADGVTVRAWSPDDLGAFVTVYGDETIAHWLSLEPVTDPDSGRTRLSSIIARSEAMEPGLGLFALVPDAVGHPVGSVMIKPLDNTGLIEIGWNQAKPWSGNGYVTAGARLLLRHAFTTAGLTQLHAIILPNNERSLGVARRIGLHDTGAMLTVEGLAHVLLRLTADQWRASGA